MEDKKDLLNLLDLSISSSFTNISRHITVPFNYGLFRNNK